MPSSGDAPGVLTDIGFYEVRYAGRSAAFLRAFRAIYLGVFFNVMIMATVTLAAIKIGGVLLGVDKYTVVLVAGTATVIYSATSGLWGDAGHGPAPFHHLDDWFHGGCGLHPPAP